MGLLPSRVITSPHLCHHWKQQVSVPTDISHLLIKSSTAGTASETYYWVEYILGNYQLGDSSDYRASHRFLCLSKSSEKHGQKWLIKSHHARAAN